MCSRSPNDATGDASASLTWSTPAPSTDPRRVRPLPPRDEMVIDHLTPEEGEVFFAALRS